MATTTLSLYLSISLVQQLTQRLFRLLHSDALASTFSALYGKLLVVMGIAFPMAEVISTYIPPSFYEGFYLYIYFGSMIFLVYMYATLLRDGKPKSSKYDRHQFLLSLLPFARDTSPKYPYSLYNSSFVKRKKKELCNFLLILFHKDDETILSFWKLKVFNI